MVLAICPVKFDREAIQQRTLHLVKRELGPITDKKITLETLLKDLNLDPDDMQIVADALEEGFAIELHVDEITGASVSEVASFVESVLEVDGRVIKKAKS